MVTRRAHGAKGALIVSSVQDGVHGGNHGAGSMQSGVERAR
jgi:hypothetical protein